MAERVERAPLPACLQHNKSSGQECPLHISAAANIAAEQEFSVASDLLQGDLLAEETHSGRIWSLLVLPALIGPAISVMFYPTAPARYALVVIAVIGIGTLALILGGFQYRFLRHGVQVRTLGFTLRTIPKQSIVSYSIESWGLPRGYGIRGIGNTRAYVWGNKVVHIKTTNGEVYLGHEDPERIVRELDRVTGFVTPSASVVSAGGSY